MATGGQKRKRQQEVMDATILTAEIAKNVGGSLPVLAPLEAVLGQLVALLKNAQKVKTNVDEWETLASGIKGRLESIQGVVKDKTPSESLLGLVTSYSHALKDILDRLEPLCKKGSIKANLAADADSKKIKDLAREMGEAYDRFTTGINMLTQMNVKEIQDRQESLYEATRSEQGQQMEISLLKGVETASMANGSIHKRCMKGTRESILENIEKWRLDTQSPQILWLADVAGAGKSTVAKEVAENWKSQGILAGRFFFSRDIEDTRTVKLFFTTVAQQGLAQLGSGVRTAVSKGIQKLIDPASSTLEEQCSHVFVKPLQAVRIPVVLVLDALDECEPEACQQLLQVLLPNLSNLPRLKLFLTSRPETHIRGELEDIRHQEISLRSDEISNRQDVELFMNERLKKVPLSETRTAKLVQRADGLFIWAKTVCDILEKFRGNQDQFIDRILSQNLRQMNPIYRIALDQAIGVDREEETMRAYMNLLSIILAASRPLSPNTVNQLLKSSESMAIVNDLRSVLECRSENEGICFLHPTFREFLLTRDASGRYYVDINVAQELMAGACLSVLIAELEYDKCKLFNRGESESSGEESELIGEGSDSSGEDSESSDGEGEYKLESRRYGEEGSDTDGEESEDQEEENDNGMEGAKFTSEDLHKFCLECTSSALQYSCIFWASHITSHTSRVLNIPPSLMPMVKKFLMSKLLDWIYMISVQGYIDEAATSLRRLSFIQSTECPGRWFMEISRFLKLHRNTIWESPLQVYHEFALAPSSSIFQNYFETQSFPHPIFRMGIDPRWSFDLSVQTYQVTAHILSPSQGLLATGGQKLGWAVYSVWNITTADGDTIIHPCKTKNCSVYHVSFHEQEDHMELRTGCLCGKAYTWNLAQEPYGLIDETHIGTSIRLCRWWADDGSKAIYEEGHGKQLYQLGIPGTPPIHYDISSKDKPYGWLFSPGCGHKVLQTGNPLLKVWDCLTGKQLFQRSYKGLPHARFSPDGTAIVCIRKNNVPELISAQDGSVLQHWDRVDHPRGIQFFPQGYRFLISSDPCTSLFDDAVQCKREVESRFISISPDGQKVATISSKGVSVFDHTLDKQLASYELEAPKLLNVCFSWYHSVLITVDEQSISFFQLSQKPQATYDFSPVSRVFLSPNSHYLLTLHKDCLISLWDVRSNQRLAISDPNPMAFSQDVTIEYAPDSSCAILWEKGQLKMLNIPSGLPQPIILLERGNIATHTGSPPSVPLGATFFPNSKQILVVESRSNIIGISLHDLHWNSISSLPQQLTQIQQLSISPTENLVAICSNEALILSGIKQESYQIPLLSTFLQGARFSPDGTNLYTFEANKDYWWVSCIHTANWAVHRVWEGEEYVKRDISLRMADIVMGDGWSALRFSWDTHTCHRGHHFLDLYSGKRIIPPAIHLTKGCLQYGNRSLMSFPGDQSFAIDEASLTYDHVAYIYNGQAVVIDCSSLLSHSIKDSTKTVEIWREDWLDTLESGNYHHSLRIECMRRCGSLKDVLKMIKHGAQGRHLQDRIHALCRNRYLMQHLKGIWKE